MPDGGGHVGGKATRVRLRQVSPERIRRVLCELSKAFPQPCADQFPDGRIRYLTTPDADAVCVAEEGGEDWDKRLAR
jgi:hypothetical protein